jgi:hypothetical protein
MLEALVQIPKNLRTKIRSSAGEPRSMRPSTMAMNLRQYSDTERSP